jgi:hypothetical protein
MRHIRSRQEPEALPGLDNSLFTLHSATFFHLAAFWIELRFIHGPFFILLYSLNPN